MQVELYNAEGHAFDEGRRAVHRKGMGGTHQRYRDSIVHKTVTVGDVVAYVTAHVSPKYKFYGAGKHNCQDVARQVYNWAK